MEELEELKKVGAIGSNYLIKLKIVHSGSIWKYFLKIAKHLFTRTALGNCAVFLLPIRLQLYFLPVLKDIK